MLPPCVRFLSALGCAALLMAGQVPPARAAGSDLEARELFQQVEDRFQNADSLSYTVKRVTVSNKGKAEDRWVFRYQKPDRLRIDYLVPHERTVVTDGATLWEHIPQLKKAAKTDLATLRADQRTQRISQVMARVSVDGLRLGDFERMAKNARSVRTASWLGTPVRLVEGVDPRYAVYIDKERSVLLRTEIYDRKGNLVIRTEASRLMEAAPGFWMPQEIRATYGTKDGFVQSTITLQDIRVNASLADDLFRFSVPKGVEVILH